MHNSFIYLFCAASSFTGSRLPRCSPKKKIIVKISGAVVTVATTPVEEIKEYEFHCLLFSHISAKLVSHMFAII